MHFFQDRNHLEQHGVHLLTIQNPRLSLVLRIEYFLYCLQTSRHHTSQICMCATFGILFMQGQYNGFF